VWLKILALSKMDVYPVQWPITVEGSVPGPKPPNVPVSEQERQQLVALIRARKTEQRLVLRARIILALGQGKNAPQVARELGTTRTSVRLWRRCWLEREGSRVVERLSDAERSGAPTTFTPEQWCQIMAIACEAPETCGRPITHWTARELAEEAIARGVVDAISPRHVGRFLKSGGVETAPQPVLAQPRARARRR
jgi:putative transposase